MSKTPSIETARTVKELRQRVSGWRGAGESVALVPTMGSLHPGHLTLVAEAKRRADRVVVSIFVNPTQFAPNEDLEAYPRDETGDLEKLAPHAPDLIFAPSPAEMYGSGFQTRVSVENLATDLCGVSRPHFFSGVATVVAKLLIQCWPDIAIFGEKDYQQLLVIRRMARDLNIPAEIVGAPTVREDDGLAMSSRNAYLSADERKRAPVLHETLQTIAAGLRAGTSADRLLSNGERVLSENGFAVDYLEIRHAETLAPVAKISEGPARVFAAAHLGRARLIDNIAV